MSQNTRRRAAGFTLLELMVVILIIGLSLGLVAIAIGGDNSSRAREEAEQFMRRGTYMAEQAVLNNENMGLFVEQRQAGMSTADNWCYRWQRLRGNQWQELPDLPEAHCLPPELQLEIRVENEPYEYDPDLDIQPPVLIFFPSGESVPFELAIYEADQFNATAPDNPDSVQRIQIDMMGRISWLNREAERAAEAAAR